MNKVTHLPAGVIVTQLVTYPDARGTFTELFRESWLPDAGPFRQWNVVSSQANVLRGMHVHLRHHDLLAVLSGRVVYGLKDLRIGSPTFGVTAMVEVSNQPLTTLMIPPGVAHGYYSLTENLQFYAVSEYYDPADELGCRYDDPALALHWPTQGQDPILSARDADMPSLAELMPFVPAYQTYQTPFPIPVL